VRWRTRKQSRWPGCLGGARAHQELDGVLRRGGGGRWSPESTSERGGRRAESASVATN
jgi:hypothetical protein